MQRTVASSGFVRIWAILLALTSLEILLAYLHVPPPLMLVSLLGISGVKAALIVAWFMHLRWERFSLFLVLFPALIFCILILLLVLPDARRLFLYRPL